MNFMSEYDPALPILPMLSQPKEKAAVERRVEEKWFPVPTKLFSHVLAWGLGAHKIRPRPYYVHWDWYRIGERERVNVNTQLMASHRQ